MQAGVWTDKASMKTIVRSQIADWLADHEFEFDEKRLLIRETVDDDGRSFAVAAFFPRNFEPPPETPESHAPAPGAVAETLRRLSPKQLAIVGGTIAAVALLAVVVPLLISKSGFDDSAEEQRKRDVAVRGSSDSGRNGSRNAAPPSFVTGIVRVYTGEPGFRVAIDGQPAMTKDGLLLTTPCAVTTEQGSQTVSVFRQGWYDQSRVVDVGEDSEVTFSPSEATDGSGSDILASPHLNAKVGEPIELTSLNSTRPELDPYVTPDGLSIWFVGDRSEGRGIYVATRLTPFDDFDPPRKVWQTADLPGSPSVTADALYVVYSVPEKARLMALTRTNPLAPFSDKQPIKADRSLAPTWTSAQILGDGRRAYWFESGKKDRTLMSSRSARDADFKKTYEYALPGRLPCLSRDGLRQYVFDGKKLTRYRRPQVTKKFGPGEVIAEVELDNYQPGKQRRQYFLSSDEQWLFYCDDPEAGGDLFMVRLFSGPHWGVPPRGQSISPKPVAAKDPDPVGDPENADAKPPEPVDPRSLPLPYTSHWKIFTTLTGNRQYDEAEGLIRNAKSTPTMQPYAEQLAWDEAELKLVRQFWRGVEKGAASLKEGDAIRVGNNRAEFIRFEDGVIVAQRGTSEIRKPLTELSPNELAALFDVVNETSDGPAQFQVGVFLYYDARALRRSAEIRLDRADSLADQFKEQQVRRRLVQAVAELERSNFGRGVTFLKEAQPLAEGLPIAQEVASMQAKLYSYIKWTEVGPRQWKRDGTAWEAPLERARGAFLLSEEQYENFELTLEWKTVDAITAQGGVYFRYPGSGDITDRSFKIQLANDAGVNPDAYSTGSLLGVVAPDQNVAKKAGEWNTLHIRLEGDNLSVTINGREVLDTSASDENLPKRGHVALDGVAGGITYRKVLVSELPRSSSDE